MPEEARVHFNKKELAGLIVVLVLLATVAVYYFFIKAPDIVPPSDANQKADKEAEQIRKQLNLLETEPLTIPEQEREVSKIQQQLKIYGVKPLTREEQDMEAAQIRASFENR